MNRSLIEEVISDIAPLLSSDFVLAKPTLISNRARTSFTIKNEKNRVVFTAEAMGLKKENIEMSIKNKYLNVFSNAKDNNSPFKSCLSHNVYVGDNIDRDRVEAVLENGILTISMQLQENKKDFSIKF